MLLRCVVVLGYGSASASITLRLTWDDDGAHFRCLADVPGGEGLVSAELYVTLGYFYALLDLK